MPENLCKTAKKRRFAARLKHEPCLVCGRHGVDVAHLLPVSTKARDWSTRSHKDSRFYVAIPLCRKCHDSLHTWGESWLDDKLPGGRMFAYAYALRVLAELHEEECDG